MTDSIRHRGPDDDGRWSRADVGIGMRRLSIVDLSASGHQPLFNEDELRRRRLQRRDLQPPRPALAAGGERSRLPRHQRHRGAGPRLRAARGHGARPTPGGNVRVRAARSAAPAAVPGARRLRHQAALPAADGAAAVVRLGDPRASLTTARGRSPSIRPSRTPSCASATSRRPRPPSRASRSSRPGRCCEIDLADRRDPASQTFYRLAPAEHRGRATRSACSSGCASCSTRPCAGT